MKKVVCVIVVAVLLVLLCQGAFASGKSLLFSADGHKFAISRYSSGKFLVKADGKIQPQSTSRRSAVVKATVGNLTLRVAFGGQAITIFSGKEEITLSLHDGKAQPPATAKQVKVGNKVCYDEKFAFDSIGKKDRHAYSYFLPSGKKYWHLFESFAGSRPPKVFSEIVKTLAEVAIK